MKKLLMVLVVLQLFQESKAQIGVVNNMVQSNSYPGAQVYQIPIQRPGLEGSPYLIDNWQVGNVYLKQGGKIENTPIKYDILKHELLFRESQRVMLVKLNYVDSFNILLPSGEFYSFIINRTWKNNGVDASGVYQTLTKINRYSLVKKHEILLIRANYNVALSAGEKNDRLEKKFKLYFLDSSNDELTEVPKGKKKISQYFNDPKITTYIKENKPALKEETGLIELVEFSTSIQKQ